MGSFCTTYTVSKFRNRCLKQNNGGLRTGLGYFGVLTDGERGEPWLCEAPTCESVDLRLGARVHVARSLFELGGSLACKPRLVVLEFQLRRRVLVLAVEYVGVLHAPKHRTVRPHLATADYCYTRE